MVLVPYQTKTDFSASKAFDIQLAGSFKTLGYDTLKTDAQFSSERMRVRNNPNNFTSDKLGSFIPKSTAPPGTNG